MVFVLIWLVISINLPKFPSWVRFSQYIHPHLIKLTTLLSTFFKYHVFFASKLIIFKDLNVKFLVHLWVGLNKEFINCSQISIKWVYLINEYEGKFHKIERVAWFFVTFWLFLYPLTLLDLNLDTAIFEWTRPLN